MKGTVIVTKPPIQAVCQGCHIARRGFDAQAETMTSSGQEACAVCHDRGKEFAVETVPKR